MTKYLLDTNACIALTLVTSNVREFDRVAGLRWEDWAAPRGKNR
jgi:predicted nucleic acid-binding protein